MFTRGDKQLVEKLREKKYRKKNREKKKITEMRRENRAKKIENKEKKIIYNRLRVRGVI